MDEGQVVILSTPTTRDGVRPHLEAAVHQFGKDLNLKLQQIPHVTTGLECLQNGIGDLFAISAVEWETMDCEGLEVLGTLTRKEPTWILVSDDKPEYLPQYAIIICEHDLLRRQFLRTRQDANVMTRLQWVQQNNVEAEYAELVGDDEQWQFIERHVNTPALQGLIVPRSYHSTLKFSSRRHTLGIQRDVGTQNRDRFIPPPLYGFTLLIGRVGFPTQRIAPMLNQAAFLAYKLEKAMFNQFDDDLKHIVGIFVEQRKMKTILLEAERLNDEVIQQHLLNVEGKPDDVGVRMEFYLETLDYQGRITASVERKVKLEDSHIGMVNAMKEFLTIVTTLSSDQDQLTREVRGMPVSYGEFSTRMLQLYEPTSDEDEEP